MRSYRSPCIELASQIPNLCNFFFENSSNSNDLKLGPANIILIRERERERERERAG
jgi:hypothetical protein